MEQPGQRSSGADQPREEETSRGRELLLRAVARGTLLRSWILGQCIAERPTENGRRLPASRRR